jgi:isoleucyl-tRNA synthetase
MIAINKQINWYPPETGSGRFGNWLEENRDWALSRDRYWGTPLPVWGCDCKDCDCPYTVIGSIEELKKRSINFREVYPDDKDIDLHKPMIDKIKIKCDKCGCEMNRVEEVIDAWYDSGSMPFAQHHFPFENKERFERNYPADFIAEAVDQTRGWFYSLHAIGSFLFNKMAYKNLIVNDHIQDKDGVKMSKHLGNIVDPFYIMDTYGADVLRWYIISSSPPWRPKMFNEDDLVEARNKFFDTLINTYRFFALYSNLLGVNTESLTANRVPFKQRPEIDRWILSAMNTLKKDYFGLMESYDITKATRIIYDFTIDDLSNWYIRRNRKRFRNPADEQDKLSAYQTLYEVLVDLVKLISPVAPFLSEELYKNLTGGESVHLSFFGEVKENEIDHVLESEMETAQKIVYLVRTMRVKFNLKTRQPLRQILIPVMNDELKHRVERMKNIILQEVNVKELNFVGEDSGIIRKKAKPNFKLLGPKYGKDMKAIAEAIRNFDHKMINTIEKEGKVKITISGADFEIAKDDLEVQTENIEGWIVESSDNLTVALDTKLDEQLVNEGLAREFINRVQNMRKGQLLGVNDKISIKCVCEGDLFEALSKQKKYIEEETMSARLELLKNGDLAGSEELNINGRSCKISIEKLLQT